MCCASKQSCRKSHLSYVCYTFEELLLCVQNQRYISGTVLFQGLLYIYAVNPLNSRGRVLHVLLFTHTWSVDWMCRGLDFSEKLYAGPRIHHAWPVQMRSTQHIKKLLQRTQLSPCFIGHGLSVRLWSNSSEVKGRKSLSINSTNAELWLFFSQRESWKSETKPLLKWETTWVQVSTRNLVPVLRLGKPDSQGLESAGLCIRLTALENLFLGAKPCSEKLSIHLWTSSWTPFAFIIIFFLLTRTITSRMTILPTSASYLYIFCLISILESLSPASPSFLIGSEAKRISLSLKAFFACH